MKLVDLLERMPRSGITAVALLLCVLVGLLDGMSGPDYSLVPFYLVPVILTAWFVGKRAGYILSFASALA